MRDIKNYHSTEHSLSNGQVLMRNYSFEEALVIIKEMTDVLVLDLVEKQLITDSVTIWVAYDHRSERPGVNGTVKFSMATNRSSLIIENTGRLFQSRKICSMQS